MPIIAPSLLAADFLQLGAACRMVNESEAQWLHLDVMDGHFVPNISFGPPVISQVTRLSRKRNDVHLMISEPARYIEVFREAGADNLTIHLEASTHLHSDINRIRNLGMKAGVAINPHTPVELLHDILPELDLVCVMSVNPGFGGQTFIPRTLEKVATLRRMIREAGLAVLIEVDGGVTIGNAGEILAAGADVLVAGSSVFRAPDPTQAIRDLLAHTHV